MDCWWQYREVSTRRTFRLVCRCCHNGCGEGCSESENWARHGRVTGHHTSCTIPSATTKPTACVSWEREEGAGPPGNADSLSIECYSNKALYEGNLALLIEFRKPETTSGYLKTWFQTRRIPAIDNIDLVPSFSHDEEILACGKVTKLHSKSNIA